MGISAANLISQLIVFLVLGSYILSIVVGFTVIRGDADRHGQPGILWAVLTIPLGWMVLLAYLVVRALTVRPVWGDSR